MDASAGLSPTFPDQVDTLKSAIRKASRAALRKNLPRSVVFAASRESVHFNVPEDNGWSFGDSLSKVISFQPLASMKSEGGSADADRLEVRAPRRPAKLALAQAMKPNLATAERADRVRPPGAPQLPGLRRDEKFSKPTRMNVVLDGGGCFAKSLCNDKGRVHFSSGGCQVKAGKANVASFAGRRRKLELYVWGEDRDGLKDLCNLGSVASIPPVPLCT